MQRPRRLVLLAWTFCAVTGATALYEIVSILTQHNKQADQYANLVFTLVPILFAIPAALIITHQPRNVIGWLLMIDPLVDIPSSVFSVYFSGFQAAPPPTLFNLFAAWLV